MTGFRHRGYLGWITDLASQPGTNEAWPSMRLDERLLADYRETFAAMKELGYNEISVWGLYVSRAWPANLKSAVTPERGARVEKLIAAAHEKGLRVLSGLGVYSWGFEEIIRANPKLARGNPQAMCPSEPESWEWMRKVVDFVFERFAIDGVSMQSADQGRCPCPDCKRHGDADYHALLNVRTAEHIRGKWPGKIIGVNSWGMRFGDPRAQPALVKMSRALDYLIDVGNTSAWGGAGYRKKLIESLACDFGTLGGPQVEPPQHWDRERWFLPTLKRTGEHLQALARDGGRACEYFFHIRANPGDEASFRLAGKVLADPATPWEKHLQGVVEEIFGATRAETRDALAQLLVQAEDAYLKHGPQDRCGTISMEPLIGDKPGPAVYLKDGLKPPQRAAYAEDLRAIRAAAEKLAPGVPRKEQLASVVRCLDNALRDLAALE